MIFQEICWRYTILIPNIRDNFAGNFDTFAGSFDRSTSGSVLATDGCMIISGKIRQCNFGNYNSFALHM